MAQQPRFEVEDIERLFRALIPSGQPDPFGRLEELLLRQAEELTKDGIITDNFRKEVLDELDSIKSRTFGILFLQIFKVLRIFLGLLPGGRIIIIVIAALALLQTVLEDGEISPASIAEAVRNTGLAKFIDDILEELNEVVGTIADNVSELTDGVSVVFVEIAGSIDKTVGELGNVAATLIPDQTDSVEELRERMLVASLRLTNEARRLLPASNSAANGADILAPALRGIAGRIRAIPGLALKLVRFN